MHFTRPLLQPSAPPPPDEVLDLLLDIAAARWVHLCGDPSTTGLAGYNPDFVLRAEAAVLRAAAKP